MKREYRERNELLVRLGFPDYRTYLRSSLWKSIRHRLIRRFGGECQCCWRRARAIHHLNYTEAVLMGEDDGSLLVVCRRCHQKAEVVNGEKASLEKANRTLLWKRDQKLIRLGLMERPPKKKWRPRSDRPRVARALAALANAPRLRP